MATVLAPGKTVSSIYDHPPKESEDLYQEVTTSRPWRWSLGRVSCALRIPVYLIYAGFQTAKMCIKFAVSVLTLGQLYRCKATRDWSFSGIARDGIMLMSLSQRAVNSLWCFVWAPPKSYRSMDEVFAKSFEAVFIGSYHPQEQHPAQKISEFSRVEDCWKSFYLTIPAYHKQIIQSDSIDNCFMEEFKKTALFMKTRQLKIKAG